MLLPKSSPSIDAPEAEGPPRCCISPSFDKHALMGDEIYNNLPLWDFYSSPSSLIVSSGAPGTIDDNGAAVVVAVVSSSRFPVAALST